MIRSSQGRLVLALVLLLQACAVQTTRERQPRVVQPMPMPAPSRPAPPAAPPPAAVLRQAPAPQPSAPAVLALLDRADQQYAARDLDSAAGSLERALRIEPRNPRLWHRLAAVRLDQGQLDQAIQLAAKSNSLAGYDRGLQARNWRLIASARYAKGDVEGARAAEAKAAALQ